MNTETKQSTLGIIVEHNDPFPENCILLILIMLYPKYGQPWVPMPRWL